MGTEILKPRKRDSSSFSFTVDSEADLTNYELIHRVAIFPRFHLFFCPQFLCVLIMIAFFKKIPGYASFVPSLLF